MYGIYDLSQHFLEVLLYQLSMRWVCVMCLLLLHLFKLQWNCVNHAACPAPFNRVLVTLKIMFLNSKVTS